GAAFVERRRGRDCARACAGRDGDPLSGRLDGRVAAITGSSRGIGLAVARAFLAEGAGVVVNSRDQAVAEKVAHELGAGAVGVGAEVTAAGGAGALDEAWRQA